MPEKILCALKIEDERQSSRKITRGTELERPQATPVGSRAGKRETGPKGADRGRQWIKEAIKGPGKGERESQVLFIRICPFHLSSSPQLPL